MTIIQLPSASEIIVLQQKSLNTTFSSPSYLKPFEFAFGELTNLDIVFCIYSTNAYNFELVADVVKIEIDYETSAVGVYRFYKLYNDYLVVCFSSDWRHSDANSNFDKYLPELICMHYGF